MKAPSRPPCGIGTIGPSAVYYRGAMWVHCLSNRRMEEPSRRRKCAVISNAHFYAAYRLLTVREIENSVSGSDPEGRYYSFDLFINSGAGDGIRTHDPNLGKVVLYP